MLVRATNTYSHSCCPSHLACRQMSQFAVVLPSGEGSLLAGRCSAGMNGILASSLTSRRPPPLPSSVCLPETCCALFWRQPKYTEAWNKLHTPVFNSFSRRDMCPTAEPVTPDRRLTPPRKNHPLAAGFVSAAHHCPGLQRTP